MKRKDCSGKNAPRVERNPSCLPDNISDWFDEIMMEAQYANTPEKLSCIIDLANKIKRTCRNTPYTKEFIGEAFNDVVSTASEKIDSIRTNASDEAEGGNLLKFASRRNLRSALEALREVEDEEKSRYQWF